MEVCYIKAFGSGEITSR